MYNHFRNCMQGIFCGSELIVNLIVERPKMYPSIFGQPCARELWPPFPWRTK